MLDGETLNPGDLDWGAVAAQGELTVHPRTSRDLTAARLQGAHFALTNKAPIDAATMDACPDLVYIGVLATGTNIVDVEAARQRGIAVTNVPGYSTDSVAQLTFSLIFDLAMRVGTHADSVERGDWAACPDFTYRLAPLHELAGRTLGILGYGAIGQAVGRIGSALGMAVLAHARRPIADGDVQGVDLTTLFRRSDILTLHCPLTPETDRVVNAERLATMKRGAWLINTARGGLLDEAAVAEALRIGQLGAAGLDVLSTEPPRPDNPLLSAPNCRITPHIAWSTLEARQRLMAEVAENVAAYRHGELRNRV